MLTNRVPVVLHSPLEGTVTVENHLLFFKFYSSSLINYCTSLKLFYIIYLFLIVYLN